MRLLPSPRDDQRMRSQFLNTGKQLRRTFTRSGGVFCRPSDATASVVDEQAVM